MEANLLIISYLSADKVVVPPFCAIESRHLSAFRLRTDI